MASWTEEKPWGTVLVIECNDQYMMKYLTMLAGKQCSLQYHEKKRETFLVLSGEMEFIVEDATGALRPIRYKAGDFFTIPPGVKHRMRAVTDIIYVEASTPHPDDVVRMEDDYGR